MGIIEELQLDKVHSKEELQEQIKTHIKSLRHRINAPDLGLRRKAEDQKRFVDSLEEIMDVIPDEDIDIQTILRTYGFAFDTQGRYSFVIEYGQIRKAIEGDSEEAYKIAIEIKKTDDQQLAGIWEDWAVNHGYSIPSVEQTLNSRKDPDRSPNTTYKAAKKQEEIYRQQKKDRNTTKKQIYDSRKKYNALVAAGLILIAIISIYFGRKIIISIDSSRHPSYMVGTWVPDGGPFPDLVLYSDGTCHDYVNGKWYVEGDKLHTKFYFRKNTYSIISESEISDDFENVYPNHYKKKESRVLSEVTEKLGNDINDEQGQARTDIGEQLASDEVGSISGEKKHKNDDNPEFKDKESICYAPWYDCSTKYGDFSAFINYLEPEDYYGNGYISGVGGRTSQKNNWCAYHVNKQMSSLTGRVVLSSEYDGNVEDSPRVRVYCDNKLEFESKPVIEGYKGEDIEVDLSDVEDLRVSIDGIDQIRLVDCYISKVEVGKSKKNEEIKEEIEESSIENIVEKPEDAVEYDGHYYKFYDERIDWGEAKEKCEELGGHLVTITNGQEQDFIESLKVGKAWIGGTRSGDSDWGWITGEPFAYTHWAAGEPNNSSNVISNENCIAIWPRYWNDLNEKSREQGGYICEWD